MFKFNNMNLFYNSENNEKLKIERGLNFEDIEEALNEGASVYIEQHSNPQKYPNQQLMYVEINKYFCVVPFIFVDKNTLFLKTIYKSRKINKLYGNRSKL